PASCSRQECEAGSRERRRSGGRRRKRRGRGAYARWRRALLTVINVSPTAPNIAYLLTSPRDGRRFGARLASGRADLANAAEVIQLADCHALVAQDGVSSGDVEEEVGQGEFGQVAG